MSLTLVTPATVPVISLAELGDHLRLPTGFGDDPGTGGADDAALTRALAAATATIERALSTAFLRQTWDWRLPDWPSSHQNRAQPAILPPTPATIPLPLSPVLSITSVAFINKFGAVTPWSPANWRLDISGPRPSLRAVAEPLPAPPDGGHIILRFDAGYGDAADAIPPDLRHAVLLLAAHYFEHRDAAAPEPLAPIPQGVSALLAPYRRLHLS